MLTGISLIS